MRLTKVKKEPLNLERDLIELLADYTLKYEGLKQENEKLKAKIAEQNDIISFYRRGWNLR